LLGFLGLGFSIGVWAVQLADLQRAVAITTAELGVALALMSAAGLVLGLLGFGRADELPRRWLAVGGPLGVAVMLASLAIVDSYVVLLVTVTILGLATTVYDVSVNTLGGDHERQQRAEAMTLLHAGFSGGAASGALATGLALAAGVSFRAVYLAAGVLLGAVALHLSRADLPLRRAEARASARETEALGLLRTPGVLLAAALVALAFFGDSSIESYSSIYLRGTLTSGALLGGVGLGVFYGAGLVGCLLGGTVARRIGDSRTVCGAGLLIAIGIAILVASRSAPLAIAGLLVVGVASAPVVPIAFTIGGRAAGTRGAGAVALITTAGYGSFLIAPLETGILASLLSLRIALLTIVVPALGISLIGYGATRRSNRRSHQPRGRDAPDTSGPA
jgi:predicted MFS family arabinose efflux permease